MTKKRLIKVSDFEEKIKIFIPHLRGVIDDLENLLNSTNLEDKVNAIGALNEIINFFNDRICEFRINKGESND